MQGEAIHSECGQLGVEVRSPTGAFSRTLCSVNEDIADLDEGSRRECHSCEWLALSSLPE